MKILAQIFLFVGILSLLGETGVAANQTIQSKIDATPEGGTLKIESGVYNETILLKKPITVEGQNGVVLSVCSSKPVIKVSGKNITVKGIRIESCKLKKNTPAIYIIGSHNKLENISIASGNTGIKVENSHYTTFDNIKITGLGKENGIDLWQSTHNTFNNILLNHVQDGFYLENSEANFFSDNRIQDSRYGIHLMFSNDITIKNNVSTRNFTGAMIMGTRNSMIEENNFSENNQNVNSQGLLLYDVHDSTIINNQLSHNRVGLFMDQTSGTAIENNEFAANYIGGQFNHFKSNRLINNSFISNVSEIQANNGSNNTIQKNYWDAAETLDTDGDGISELPYKVDPYFLTLTTETPAYQLFFQHPGMLLLQKMLKSPDHSIVTDQEPLMKNTLKKTKPNASQQTNSWMMSLLMIFCSLFIIFIGRRKKQ